MSSTAPPIPPVAANHISSDALGGETVAVRSPRSSMASQRSTRHEIDPGSATKPAFAGVARHTLGLILLLLVVFLWTASNFLASTIFADDTYSKPFFVTYLNTAIFMLPLFPVLARRAYLQWRAGRLPSLESLWASITRADLHTISDEASAFLKPDDEDPTDAHTPTSTSPNTSRPLHTTLSVRATAKLSLEFCILWFLANYFAMACLQYTTVASTTILTSTSSVWTLLFGALSHIERFTLRKLLGVLASLAGVILISQVDLSNDSNDSNRGSFPHKTRGEIAVGDAMAFCSAIIYGIYTIVLKAKVGSESNVNMPLFFGLVGFFNAIFLWPIFLILHFSHLEAFHFPPTSRVWTIVLVNGMSSLVSDIAWAYAMLLTSPLVVTVGLSMTIPLSLIGQIVLDGQYSSFVYWIGAAVVFLSFVFVNHESKEEGKQEATVREEPEYDTLASG